MTKIENEINTLTVICGRKLLEFKDFDDWVDHATKRFAMAGILNNKYIKYISVDAKGRLCLSGREFMRARDEDTFPIKVYLQLLDC